MPLKKSQSKNKRSSCGIGTIFTSDLYDTQKRRL